jgi:hypothetical protein
MIKSGIRNWELGIREKEKGLGIKIPNSYFLIPIS